MLLHRAVLLIAILSVFSLASCNAAKEEAGLEIASTPVVETVEAVTGLPELGTGTGFELVFEENCAVCHGDALQGAAQGVALVGVDLQHGDSIEALSRSIANGYPERGMPAWEETLPRRVFTPWRFLSPSSARASSSSLTLMSTRP